MREPQTGDCIWIGSHERLWRRPLWAGGPVSPPAGVTGDDRSDLTRIADQDHLGAEWAQTTQVGKGHLPGLIHNTDVSDVITLGHPQPTGGGGDHDAVPASEVSGSLQVTSLGMKVHGSMGITGA